VKECDISVKVANGHLVNVKQLGRMGGIPKVLYSPFFTDTLISNAQLIDLGHSILYDDSNVFVLNKSPDFSQSDIVLKGDRVGNTYIFNQYETFSGIGNQSNGAEARESKISERATKILDRYHLITGISKSLLKKAAEAGAFDGTGLNKENLKDVSTENSESWWKGHMKGARSTSKIDLPSDLKPMEVIGADITAKFSLKSRRSFYYANVYVDYSTSYLWIYFSKSKEEATDCLESFCLDHWSKTLAFIVLVYEDLYAENSKFKNILRRFSIEPRLSTPYHYWYNGKVERSIGLIQDVA